MIAMLVLIFLVLLLGRKGFGVVALFFLLFLISLGGA